MKKKQSKKIKKALKKAFKTVFQNNFLRFENDRLKRLVKAKSKAFENLNNQYKGLTEANDELVKDVQQFKDLYAELCAKYNQLHVSYLLLI